MTIARCPFAQEVEDHWVETAVGTMAIARRPFTKEVEDCWAKPRVTTTSRVLRHGKLRQELAGAIDGGRQQRQLTKASGR